MVNALHMLDKSDAEPLRQVLPDSQSGKFIGITIVLEHRIVLTTSVQISERTLQLLNKLKREKGLSSLDQVIRGLIAERVKIPKSMFGSNPKLRSLTSKDEAESREL